jgi:hypothetical protein
MTSRPPPFTTAGGRWVAAALLVAGLACPALAQQPRNPDPKGPTRERQGREAALRSAERVLRPSADPMSAAAAAEEVKQDFTRLQILRNELVRHLKAEGPLDLKAVAERAGEVNKRAKRLRARLVLDVSAGAEDAGPADDLDADRLRDALVRLCKTIDRFTENPVFDLDGVVDVQQSTKAGADLLSVVELSASITKSAERLKKGAT